MLFVLLLLSPLSLASEENTAANETITDGRITGFQSDLSQDYLRQWNMSEGEWFSISLNCNQCEAQVTIDGITTTTTSILSLQSSSNSSVDLLITSPVEEYISYSLVQNIDENYATTRPAPSESLMLNELPRCEEVVECLQPNRGNLFGFANGEFSESQYLRGILQQAIPAHLQTNHLLGLPLHQQLNGKTTSRTVRTTSGNPF